MQYPQSGTTSIRVPSLPTNLYDRFCCSQLLLDVLLPLSYSHLLFRPRLARLQPEGLGVAGASPPKRLALFAPSPAPSGLGELKELRRGPAEPPPLRFFSSGLVGIGEKVELFNLIPEAGLPLPESGELA